MSSKQMLDSILPQKIENRICPNKITGCKTTIKNNVLSVSSGIPQLDELLGDGLTIGSALLLEEDLYGNYSNIMLRYFLAEGVVCGHDLYIATSQVNPQEFITTLPAIVSQQNSKDVVSDNSKMSIAWRYSHLPSQRGSAARHLGHHFDLTKTMTEDSLKSVELSMYNSSSDSSYKDLLNKIAQKIKSSNYTTTGSRPENVLRVCIQSLGSPLWHTTKDDISLAQFLFSLRSLLRYSYVVVMVTVPSHLFTASQLQCVRSLCDMAIKLDSFAVSDREVNPLYRDYHGLFCVTKRPSINYLTYTIPQPQDLAFKLRRKKFIIEKLHLPPSLSATVSRTQGPVIPEF